MFKKAFSSILIIIVLLASSSCTSGIVNKNMYTATVEADTFYIMSEINGKVSEVSIHQGDSIKEGQNVIMLDSTLYELQKQQAEAALQIASSSQSSLTENPRQSMKSQSQAAVSQAQAAVDSAQLQINKCTVSSQVDGTVSAVYISEGQVVSPSSPTSNNIVKITGPDNKSYIVSAEVTGRIVELNVSQGEVIKAGQVIAKIDPSAYELQKKQALASLSAAKAQQSALTENPKQSQLSQTKGSVEQAKAAVDIAQLQIDRCSIKSEGNGVIEDVYVNKGEMVSAGMNIARVMDLNSKNLRVYVEESKRNHIKLGQSLSIYIDGKPSGSGTVVYISSESEFTPKNVETKSQKDKTVFEVKIKLDPNIEAAPGAMVDVEIK